MMDCGGMMGLGWLMMGFWLLVVVGIVLLLVWGIRHLGGQARNTEETPLATLQRRYARGVIGPEEADLQRDGGDR